MCRVCSYEVVVVLELILMLAMAGVVVFAISKPKAGDISPSLKR